MARWEVSATILDMAIVRTDVFQFRVAWDTAVLLGYQNLHAAVLDAQHRRSGV